MACMFNRCSALFLRASFLPLTLLLASQTVMAAGNHEGGHGHDQATGIGRPGMVHDEPNSVSLPPGVQVAANTAETDQDLIWAEGEVRKVDPQTGKITIKHGPLIQLDMPPMTMVFTVMDKTLLDNLQVGDPVSFQVVSEDGGKLVVTDIKPAAGDHSSHH
jgi:Cu(I)/Ag(I) efflux system protein CusF